MDLSLTASPPRLVVSPGGEADVTLTALSLSGFSGTVAVSVSAGFSAPALSLTVPSGGYASEVLHLTCPASAGEYWCAVTGVSGGLTRSCVVPVTVQALEAPTAVITAGTSLAVEVPQSVGFRGSLGESVTFTAPCSLTVYAGDSPLASGSGSLTWVCPADGQYTVRLS